MSGKRKAVRVVGRMRPHLAGVDGPACPIELDTASNTVRIPNPKSSQETLEFCLDSLYSQTTSRSIYNRELAPLVKTALQGTNATCFAYGPTGAGKTHTMVGDSKDPGLIPLAMKELLQAVANPVQHNYRRISLTASMCEIYQERVYDLLSNGPRTAGADLPVRATGDGVIFVAGLTKAPLSSLADYSRIATAAHSARATGATTLNATSSRSHCVLAVHITTQAQSGAVRQSKLQLIDLAGAEDNRRTDNVGERLKESGAINKSLFVLKAVVSALLDGATSTRIPYRDSKLTRLLQDSLGGSAQATMIACWSPTASALQDTAKGLAFASRTRKVVNSTRVQAHQAPTASSAARRTPLGTLSSNTLGNKDRAAALAAWKASKSKPSVPSLQQNRSTSIGSATNINKGKKRPANTSLNSGRGLSGGPKRARSSAGNRSSVSSQGESDSEWEYESEDEQDVSFYDPTADEAAEAAEAKETERAGAVASLESAGKAAVARGAFGEALVLYSQALVSMTPKSQKKMRSRIALLQQQVDGSGVMAGGAESSAGSGGSGGGEAALLDIMNTGGLTQLLKLPGIGAKRAASIVDARGGSATAFSSLDDLSALGLGPKTIRGLLNSV